LAGQTDTSARSVPLRARSWYRTAKTVVGVLVALTVLGNAQKFAATVHVDPHYADAAYNNDPGTIHTLTQVLHLCVTIAICLAAFGVWGLCTRLMRVRYSASRRVLIGGGAQWQVRWVDGIASTVSKTVRTHVSGSTGPSGGGVSSTTTVQDNFVLTDRLGHSSPFQVTGLDMVLDNGHRAAVVLMGSGKKRNYLLVRNISTRTTYVVRGSSRRAIRGVRFTTLYFWAAIPFFVTAWLLSFRAFAVLSSLAIFGLLILGHFVKRFNRARFDRATRKIVTQIESPGVL
jgi:hypothetical protein